MTPVPERYRGVWARTLLQTPGRRDDSTFVRWLQTTQHHADLRIPAGPRDPAALQGFSGCTTVDDPGGDEVCHWHRELDLQPPGLFPDAGHMRFETPDRVIETGVHGDYLEVWERLPGSTGRSVVLTRGDTRFLVAGGFAMRVRPRATAWPEGTQPGDSLADVLQRHPAQHDALLDFEISFGVLVGRRWAIERSTLPELEGHDEACAVRRLSATEVELQGPAGAAVWQVLEWDSAADSLD